MEQLENLMESLPCTDDGFRLYPGALFYMVKKAKARLHGDWNQAVSQRVSSITMTYFCYGSVEIWSRKDARDKLSSWHIYFIKKNAVNKLNEIKEQEKTQRK